MENSFMKWNSGHLQTNDPAAKIVCSMRDIYKKSWGHFIQKPLGYLKYKLLW